MKKVLMLLLCRLPFWAQAAPLTLHAEGLRAYGRGPLTIESPADGTFTVPVLPQLHTKAAEIEF